MSLITTDVFDAGLVGELSLSGAIDPSTLPLLKLWYEPSKQGLSNGANLPTFVDYSGQGNTGTITGTITYDAPNLAASFAGGSCKSLSPAFFTSGFDHAFTLLILPKGNNSGLTVHHSIGASYYGDRNAGQIGYALPLSSPATVFEPTTRQPIIEVVRYDGTNFTFVANGFAYVYQAGSGNMGLNGDALTLGQLGGGFQWLGDIRIVLVGETAWPDSALRGLYAYLGSPQTVQVICDGNSLTSGAGGQYGWPTYAFDALGVGWGGYNTATVGISISTLISRFSATVPPLQAPGLLNIVCEQEFTNTLAPGTVSVATAEAQWTSLCAAARGTGAKVVSSTILPCTSSGVANPTLFETQRQTINTWMRGQGTTYWDALADLGGDATIGAPGATLNATYYQSDQVHLTNAGQQIAQGYFQAAIRSL
jgi:hypothetical protein